MPFPTKQRWNQAHNHDKMQLRSFGHCNIWSTRISVSKSDQRVMRKKQWVSKDRWLHGWIWLDSRNIHWTDGTYFRDFKALYFVNYWSSTNAFQLLKSHLVLVLYHTTPWGFRARLRGKASFPKAFSIWWILCSSAPGIGGKNKRVWPNRSQKERSPIQIRLIYIIIYIWLNSC